MCRPGSEGPREKVLGGVGPVTARMPPGPGGGRGHGPSPRAALPQSEGRAGSWEKASRRRGPAA